MNRRTVLMRSVPLLVVAAFVFGAASFGAGCGNTDGEPETPTPTCRDGVQNGDEEGVDCGGSCEACEPEPTCHDGEKNGDEKGVDCGGSCAPCESEPTCSDGMQNGDETGVDCGGSCAPCQSEPTCSDGKQNGDEKGVDCGGDCEPCTSCNDGKQNGGETGVDCGGPCAPCPTCNDGKQNGDEEGVDCGGSCDRACPTCNDGKQNGDETGVDCGGSCPDCKNCVPDAKRIFTTSRGYNGDLAAAAGTDSGLAGGDALCQRHAEAAGLEGTWVAWLSTDNKDAIDRVEDVGPWYLVDRCTKVTDGLDSLVIDGPQTDVNVAADGDGASGNSWTGTEDNGRASGFDCSGWTNESPVDSGLSGVGSDSFVDGAWTEASTIDCNKELSLICFEQ